MKNSSAIVEYLKHEGKLDKISMHEIRKIQESEKILKEIMDSYDDLPRFSKHAMKSFRIIEMFIFTLMMEEYPKFLKFHENILEMFGNDCAFDDGVTIQAWLYFNFPVNNQGQTIATLALNELSTELAVDLTPFVTEMVNTRFGLYEVLNVGDETSLIKEMHTNKEILLKESLGGAVAGTVMLLRIFTFEGDSYIFGDINEWPAHYKESIFVTVTRKMTLYYPRDTAVKSYVEMMRVAGPYWFSIIAKEYEGDILDPDYCFKYYN